MSVVNPTQVTPGSDITSSSVNTPINEIASVINGQIDDANISNLSGSKLASGSVTTAKLDDGAVTPDKISLSPATSRIATTETTTSTSYTDLATVHSVTVTVGANGLLLVNWGALLSTSATSNAARMSVDLSGANTLAASDDYVAYGRTTNSSSEVFGSNRQELFTGLTPGSTTITAKYRTTGGTATFQLRTLTAIPL